MNLPIRLTLLRIVAIPLVAIVYVLPFPWTHPAAAIIFALAAITDWLDGYLARNWSQMTKLGAFLDPVADKLLVAVVLVMVISYNKIPYLMLPAMIIIGREIVISALREWMSEIGSRANVAVSYVGKLKATIQMVALALLLWNHPHAPAWMLWLGVVLLYASVILTVWSMLVYLKLAWPDLTLSGE